MYCHSTRRRRCIVLYCAQAACRPVIPVIYLESERALARKFAPIPFHSRARHGPSVAAENRIKPTDVTRSSARIARGEGVSPVVRRRVYCAVSLVLFLHFPSTVTSASSIARRIPFVSNPRPWCRSALLIDSLFNRCLITSQLDRGV